MEKRLDISVVVPLYNEEDTINYIHIFLFFRDISVTICKD